MSLVDRAVRSLTARAEEDSRMIAIPRRSFYSIVKKEPPLAVKILWSFVQVLGSRLRKTTADLSDALHHQTDRPGSEGQPDVQTDGDSKPDEPFPG
jgi:CRP-like cAMP-binding protein